jgi:hypothetical protein
MAQQEAADAREEADEWRERAKSMGDDITALRLELMRWEDKDLAWRKRAEAEEMLRKMAEGDQEEEVWVCPWMDAEHRTRCSALVDSQEVRTIF